METSRTSPAPTVTSPPRDALREPVPVFFLSDSTGITAQALGTALLVQFPDLRFARQTFPFIRSVDEAREIVQVMDAAAQTQPQTLVFSTAVTPEIRAEIARTRATLIDFFGSHIDAVEGALGEQAVRSRGRAHGLGNIQRYDSRMQAVEYAIEHDDGQSLRGLDKADIILVAPSRCGKTPTTMYLALQHGLFVANYPLVEDDFDSTNLPRPIAPYRDRCFGILTTPKRLHQVRTERRAGSAYAALDTCVFELRRAAAMFEAHRIPYVNSANMSVEEMSATILHTMKLGT